MNFVSDLNKLGILAAEVSTMYQKKKEINIPFHLQILLYEAGDGLQTDNGLNFNY